MSLLPFFTLIEYSSISYPISHNYYATTRSMLSYYSWSYHYSWTESSLTAIAITKVKLKIWKLKLTELGDILNAICRTQFEQTFEIIKIDSFSGHSFSFRWKIAVSITDNNSSFVLLLLITWLKDNITVKENKTYWFWYFWFLRISIKSTTSLHLLVIAWIYISKKGLC